MQKRAIADAVVVSCNAPALATVKATSPSEGLDVYLPPGPGQSKDGTYNVTEKDKRYSVTSQYLIDTNVRVAGPKTHSVVYSVTIE